jgi:hypothetical protein
VWDGLEGSLAKFGYSVGFVRFANVPDSEEKGALGCSLSFLCVMFIKFNNNVWVIKFFLSSLFVFEI